MEQNEEIEMQIWEFIDNACSQADQERISMLIVQDISWREKFNELNAFHSGTSQSLELEHPSMRFTKNVMDAVAVAHIAPATKKYVNISIIRGIAAFFILTI